MPLAIRDTTFTWGARTYIMGILNLTPDSFSGDGLARETDMVTAALAQAQRMLDEGADLLDLGGESTRPGSAPVPADEELRRVLPVLRRAATDDRCPPLHRHQQSRRCRRRPRRRRRHGQRRLGPAT